MKRRTGSIIKMITMIFLCSGCDANNFFTEFDRNENGVWSETEYIRAMDEKRFFRKWDENNNHLLDKQEWMKSMKNFTAQTPESNVFRRWDMNNDFYIDKGEFIEKSFELFDENDNLELDIDEYAAWNEDVSS